MRTKKTARLLLSLFLSALLLGWVLRGVQWQEFLQTLSKARWHWIFPLGLLVYFEAYLRAIRWALILSSQKTASAKITFPALAIGLACNNLLPFRAGEFLRAYLVSKKLQLPKLTCLATVITERLFDLTILATLFLVTLPQHPTLPWVERVHSHVWVVLVVSLLLLLFGALFLKRLMAFPKIAATLQAHPQVQASLSRIERGLASAQPLRRFASILALSLTIWSIDFFLFTLMAQVLPGLQGTPPITFAFVLAAAAFSTAIPAAPGYIGTFEFAVTEALKLHQIPHTLAFSYAVILHLAGYLFTVSLGIFFFFRLGTGMEKLTAQAQEG
ncbi:MAG: flippase-like domain-containing protein [Elusimicrobia bacterium]|nr:flippase-like domain-containing protein [Elusimicrobiota bacterium]